MTEITSWSWDWQWIWTCFKICVVPAKQNEFHLYSSQFFYPHYLVWAPLYNSSNYIFWVKLVIQIVKANTGWKIVNRNITLFVTITKDTCFQLLIVIFKFLCLFFIFITLHITGHFIIISLWWLFCLAILGLVIS